MPKKLIFNQEQIDTLKSLISDNKTQCEIAKYFNTTDSTIRKICLENNIIITRAKRKYTCCACQTEFESDRKSFLCPKCKSTPATCVVCGKEFNRVHPYTQKTCSSKCRGIYRKESGIAKSIGQKMLETKMKRYGTLDPAEVTKIKRGSDLAEKECPLCHKMFVPDTPRQVYCKDKHYGPCPVCGEPTEIKDYSIGPQACSEKCRMARINATCLERYGNKDAVNSEHAKKLAKEHSLERYGFEYYNQSPQAKEHFKQVCLERYGTEHPMQNKDIQEKAKRTNLHKYGSTSYLSSEEGKAKIRSIQEYKYGGVGLASPVIMEKMIATNLERYGTRFALENEEIKKKAIRSVRAKYGVDNFLSSKEHLADIIIDTSKVDDFYEFKQDPKKYVESHYDTRPPIYVLSHDLGVSDTPVYDALIKHDCKDIIDRTKMSTMEYEMSSFLNELIPDSKIVTNDRRMIAPLELDFYMPEYNFAIECNPTLTHNSTTGSWKDADPKTYSYHQKKSQMALEKGIFLMHIFGYEWEHRRDIIKSMIRNVLGKATEKFYARKTYIKQVPYNEAKQFLIENHRQGNASSRFRLGLYTIDNNELISLMTFGLTRMSIGKRDEDTDSNYELIRFCNKLNSSVIGGASKLFKYFLNNYSPQKIISFSDIAHTRGNLYQLLGFHEVSRSDPSYVWVKPYGEIYKNRVTCQKMNLPNLFEDVDENTIQEKSERVIMIEHGYVQVYDSGVIRWEYEHESHLI